MRAAQVQVAALCVMLACVVLRLVVSYDPFPGWADDPSRLPAALTAIGPQQSMLVDAVMLIAASVVIACSAAPAAHVVWAAGLWAFGAGGAIYWANARGGGIDDAVIGLNWIAAILAGIATCIASRSPQPRRLASAVLLGVIAPLCVRAAAQYLIENPEAYADFKRDRLAIFAAHGWNVDSPLARSFERRVSQPDAGAWLGLSNVLGSIAAATTVAFAGAAWMLARRTRQDATMRTHAPSERPVLLALVAGLVASLATLAFSMSKGAMLAAGCGGVLLAISFVKPLRRFAPVVGCLCIAAPLLAVVARGLVSDRIRELSLLFRWFYMQGTLGVLREGSWLGVGPAGFQDAYMLAKPALSPENVTSPHSVLFDYAAGLGIAGIGWMLVLLVRAGGVGMTLCAGHASGNSEEARPEFDHRSELRLVVGIAAIATVLAALVEREMATPLTTGVRLGGLFLFGFVASGLLRVAARVPSALAWGASAGALAAIAHAQIDMVATTLGSSAWFWCLLGLAGAAWTRSGTAVPGSPDLSSAPAAPLPIDRPTAWRFVPVAVAVALLSAVFPAMRGAWTWQAHTTRAALLLRPLALAQGFASDPSLGGGAERARDAAAVLGGALGQPIEPTPQALDAALRTARLSLGDAAAREMLAACAAAPLHGPTYRATSELFLTQGLFRLSLARAGAPGMSMDATTDTLTAGRGIVESYLDRVPGDASLWAWSGLLNRTLLDQTADPEALPRAIDAYQEAARLDPHGVANILPLVELLQAAGRGEEASDWARAGLARHANTRLDPLAGLTPAQVARLESVVTPH